MSLRRRIAIAAAVAVAAVAIAIAVIGYVSTRSHLIGNVQHDLIKAARPYVGPHDRGGGGGPPAGRPGGPGGQGGGDENDLGQAPRQPFGGAAGDFQIVHGDGTTAQPFGGNPLPVDSQMTAIAKRASGRLFTDTHVSGTHLEVLTEGDPFDHWAIQVALPLTDVDSVLNGLLLPYGLLIGGGILFAALLGLGVSRSALRPIDRFLHRTEAVTLESPQHLEETGASELRRLAASFNRALDALERSIESQRHLVADASHELRTPIAALRSNIQIFLDAERLPDDERTELQQSILVELDELTQIVADVVELARGSAPSEVREAIELETIVREAVDRARRRAPGLTFQLDLEPTVIEGAPEQVARAVANVIDNARKWSPPDGEVEIELRAGTLSVRDHGPGFGEQDLPQVFDRFFRAADARRLPGSGLGLAIVKQAAESHGGRAEALNASGGGALVTVSFGMPVGQPRFIPPAVPFEG